MSGMSDPLRQLNNITPSDTANLPYLTRAIWVGSAGDLTVTDALGVGPTTLTGITVGWHPICVRQIWATGTTAASITVGR